MPRTILALILCSSLTAAAQDSLSKLAEDFWSWRAQYQPFNADDIPRLERPNGLRRSWSSDAVARQKSALIAFDERWKRLEPKNGPVSERVDYQLMGSALARVHWELEHNRRWQRDPSFYVEQTMSAFTEALLAPPPFDEVRSREIVARLENIPSILDDGKANLQQPAAPFARLAVGELTDIHEKLQMVGESVEPLLSADVRNSFRPAIEGAAKALESYQAWLEQRLPRMTEQTALGREE